MLKVNAEFINGLNVFPVPDGDTGTNMNMTMTSGVEQIRKHRSTHLGKCAEKLSKGLLMGARGNSGVILSQLFRGFAKKMQDVDKADVHQFAEALQQGVDTAYEAVMRPIEGTILTVAREAAAHAKHMIRRTDDLSTLMDEVLAKAKEALERTPEQLPVLKQVGVVDSGGQGLVCLYEGFARYLAEEETEFSSDASAYRVPSVHSMAVSSAQVHKAQAKLRNEDIAFPYDMEFFIIQNETSPAFDELSFRRKLEQHGDSILIIVDGNTVKVHVHSKEPGEVLNEAIRYGELTRFHIENMRDTHRSIIENQIDGEETPNVVEEKTSPRKSFGLLAVAAGKGIIQILRSLGVDEVLSGGQTMNPSTEDLLAAIERIAASTVFIFPNNSNIILAAEQAKALANKEVIVIPTKTIPQGMSAVLAFQEQLDVKENHEVMWEAAQQVRSGSITESIRDTQMDDVTIRKGDFIGIVEGSIVSATDNLQETGQLLLDKIVDSEDEIITIYTGEQATKACTDALLQYVEQHYPDVEIEVHEGGQPVYHYIISTE